MVLNENAYSNKEAVTILFHYGNRSMRVNEQCDCQSVITLFISRFSYPSGQWVER